MSATDFVGAAVLGAGFLLCTSMAVLAYFGPAPLPVWLGRFLGWFSGERVAGGGARFPAVFFAACAVAILAAEAINLVRELGASGSTAALDVALLAIEAC